MAVPEFLASSHRYDLIEGVDDVQDIIDALGTILKTSNDPVWTEPTAGTFQSPVDAYGRYFQAIVSRVDVDTLQIEVKDQYGTSIRINRIDINTGGSPAITVNVASGQYHLWIESNRSIGENFRSGMLDLSPNAQDAWGPIVYTRAYRDSAGNVSDPEASKNTVSTTFSSGSIDTSNNHGLMVTPMGPDYSGISSDLGGNIMYFPVMMKNYNARNYLGRMYQAVVVPSTIAYGSLITVPIDTSLTAQFRVCSPATGTFSFTHYKLAIRAD